ncbi:MAG TPA: Sua5/YciO/YrdC/YwlC family protein [Thermoanaerobaculia bacterium]|nr:Sua5/YciO/YrdC/YwlC family protein [Thermoanaerobaculia bacterium]
MRVVVRKEELTPGGVLRTNHLRAIVNILVDRGGFALIPSDTCYSLAARPIGGTLSKRINLILDRETDPISLAFDTSTRVGRWVEVDSDAKRLLDNLTPGPLTVVLPITELYEPHVAAIVDDVIVAPDRTIGVRIPDSRIETQLVTACNFPLTTVAVRTRDREKRAVTDFALARQVVERGLAEAGENAPLAIVEGQQPFSRAHSTVVRVPGYEGLKYHVIRLGALSTDDLDAALRSV